MSEHLLDEIVLGELDRVWASWPASEYWQQAVAATSAEHHYAGEDVAKQLALVADRCSRVSLNACAVAEGMEAAGRPITNRPGRVMHLVASSVPGLAVESICHTLALGATVVIKPSRRETVLDMWLQHLHAVASPLCERIELSTVAVPENIDAAVVFGTDETVAFVQTQLDEARNGSTPIAGYGNRTGIGIIDSAALPSAQSWLPSLSDDIATFLQRGCMSPRHLIVVGALPQAMQTEYKEALAAALQTAWNTHVAGPPTEELDVHARSMHDEQILDALFDAAPSEDTLRYESLEVELHWAIDDQHARTLLDQFATTLQTAVLVSESPARFNQLVQLASSAGCTRTCPPGYAHAPAADWPHDGIGWFTPLLRT